MRKSGKDGFVRPCMSDTSTGFRRIQERGEIQVNSWKINDLDPGKYFWRVQAINHSFAGSSFTEEQEFTIRFSNSISPVADQVILPGKDGNPLTVSETEPVSNRQWMYSNHPGGPYTFEIIGDKKLYLPRILKMRVNFILSVSLSKMEFQ